MEPHTNFVYPDEPEPPRNEYREASQNLIRILTLHLSLLTEAKDKNTAIWGMVYAYDLAAIHQGKCMSDKAAELNVTPQALAKQKDLFRNAANLP
tara:strand:+ start:311 stop:595 length:285 start_codon:yes stop_codon:yes gene_type:complete